MAKGLPTYKPEALCPKCGHDTVGTLYLEAEHEGCDWPCDKQQSERLQRRCDRCRYAWHESVLGLQAPPVRPEQRQRAQGEEG